jgi:hypothetical protein
MDKTIIRDRRGSDRMGMQIIKKKEKKRKKKQNIISCLLQLVVLIIGCNITFNHVSVTSVSLRSNLLVGGGGTREIHRPTTCH